MQPRGAHRPLGLAASFIVTVTASAGCRDAKEPDGNGDTGQASILYRNDGHCYYSLSYPCPENVMCNPPPPITIECPEELRDGGPPSDPMAATKDGWVRVLEHVGAWNGQCAFATDYFCPDPAKTKGACETPPESLQLTCKQVPMDAAPDQVPSGGKPGWHYIDPFSATRAGGTCVRYAAFWCDGACDLPPPVRVDCKTGAPLDAPTAASATASAVATTSAAVTIASGTLNPLDAKGRVIRTSWTGQGCFVYLPFPELRPGELRPPGTSPPQETAACPPEMSKPSFQQCRGGVVMSAGASCECYVGGNPPPPPQPVPCP